MKIMVKNLIIAVFTMLVFALIGCDEPEDSSSPSPSPKTTIINISAIQGVSVPVTGENPVKSITENAQYSGTVTWNGNPVTFAADTQYIATITLTAKTGYTLQGVGANFFTVTEAIFASNAANSGVITAVFPKTGGTASNPVVINIADISGVTIPVTGETPVSIISENSQYSGTVTWNNSPSNFAADTQYTATITLTAKTGYTLQGVGANFFTVAGTTSVSNSANSGVITAVFPKTGGTASNPFVINIADISGVTIPKTGETPVSVISENSQYSGTVTWNGSPSAFAADTQYTATITLTAKTGYTLQGVGANFFTVTGATSVSNSANSGVITAVFPKTGGTTSNPDVISIADISGVTIPVTGETPVSVISENSQYSGTVTWNGSPSAFAADTQYTATITLTAKTGYTLQGVGANFFKVAGSTSVSNSANSGVVTAVFLKTAIANINPDIIELTANTWANGNIATSSGEQWFKFTATAATQYIHFQPDSLNYVYVQLYDNNKSAIGSNTIMYSNVPYISRSVTIDKEYYIKVTPYTGVGNGTGSYMIGFGTSTSRPLKQVINIAIKTQPTKLGYTHGDTLDLAGLVVTLTYYDTTTEDVTAANFTAKKITANPAQGVSLIHVTHNGKPVTITYNELLTQTTNNLTVTKAAGAWVNPTVNTTYTPTLKLGDVTLPDGYVFTAPTTTKLNAGNNQSFTATYTNPDGNYETVSGTITVNVAKSGPAAWPSAATITYGSPLSASALSGGDTTAGSFAWTSSTTFPTVTNSGYSVTFTPFDTANYTTTTGTVAITVNKAVGGTVAMPTLSRYAHNRILINAITTPATGQSVEYGISASNNANTATWQTALTFIGLNMGTTYYIFARAAENANYNTGAASGSIQVTTRSSDVLTVTTTDEWTDTLAHIADFGSGTAETPQTYTIMVSGNVAVAGSLYNSFGSVSNVTVTLKGSGKLYLTSRGNMIRTGDNQTLIIDSAALTLQGQDNNNSLIYCSGTLELKNGEITGNYSYNINSGGGVYVGGTFTMNGGTISGNSNYYGSGVYVGGTFTMNGGTISGNNSYYSGGVYVYDDGSFTMTGGTISGNDGDGVYAFSFTMTGGTISGNSDVGVYVHGSFTKTGGIIYGNDASDTNKNGYAVYYYQGYNNNQYYNYYRDSTLGENDNLYSSSPLPANSGQSLNGWTKE